MTDAGVVVNLVGLIQLTFQVAWALILIDVIASWIPGLNRSDFIAQVRRITDPMLEPFRRIVPPQAIGIDISPILAMIALSFLQRFILSNLR